MTMQARRNKAAAAEATKAQAPQTTATTKAPKAAKAAKPVADEGDLVAGTMKSIQNMQAYQESEPRMSADGTPQPRFIYDVAGRGARALDPGTLKDVPKDGKPRVVNTSDMVAHLNATVFKPIFGTALRGSVARKLLDGISHQYLTLIEQGFFVKFPNLLAARRVLRKTRPARNPRTNVAVQVPARHTIQVKPARALRDYLNASAE